MRIPLIKKFYCFVAVFLVGVKNLAAHILDADTTKLIASLTLKHKSSDNFVENNNAKYPESLSEHRDQTLDYIKNYSNKQREYLMGIYQQGQKYFPKVAEILKQYKLPEELKVLIALESGFNANAVSKAGAVGYWQIMDAVAKEYGLNISSLNTSKHKKKDERKNIDKSTLAAAKYFRDLQSNLNSDLLLMVASYNCGAGKVRSAIRKSGNREAGFWDVKNYLPAETRKYVMNFIALNVVFENFEKFSKNQLVFLPFTKEDLIIDFPVYNNSVPESAPAID